MRFALLGLEPFQDPHAGERRGTNPAFMGRFSKRRQGLFVEADIEPLREVLGEANLDGLL